MAEKTKINDYGDVLFTEQDAIDLLYTDPDFDIGGKGFQDIIYYRGAKGGKNIMNTIELLFKVANKKLKSRLIISS